MPGAKPRPNAVGNRLLAALPDERRAALLKQLTPVFRSHRQILRPQDGIIGDVYFLGAGVVSLVANLVDGVQAEVGIMGGEGVFGCALVDGPATFAVLLG